VILQPVQKLPQLCNTVYLTHVQSFWLDTLGEWSQIYVFYNRFKKASFFQLNQLKSLHLGEEVELKKEKPSTE
jgi:hypothetical protein